MNRAMLSDDADSLSEAKAHRERVASDHAFALHFPVRPSLTDLRDRNVLPPEKN